MTQWILWALIIFFVQSILPPIFRYVLRRDPKILETLGARDNPPETSVLGERSERALQNMMEASILFLPLAVLAQFGEANTQAIDGAMIFVLARAIYIPLYVFGVPVLRSIAWTIGHAGLVLIGLTVVS